MMICPTHGYSGIPSLWARNRASGHLFRTQWLGIRRHRRRLAQLELKGDRRAARLFVGPDCGLCVNPKWVVHSKNLR